MRRIIFKSLAVITLIAIIASVWVGAGERLSVFLDRFKTVRLASLSMRPLSAYNRGEGACHAGAFFIGKEEMPTSKMSDWLPFPLRVQRVGNQLFCLQAESPSGLVHYWQPRVMTSDMRSLHSRPTRRIKLPLPSKEA